MLDLAMKQLSIIDALALPVYEQMDLESIPSQDMGLRSLYRILGLAYNLKTIIYTDQNNFQASKDAFLFSVSVLKDWPIYLSRSYGNSAKSYFKQDSLYKALEHIDSGLRVCQLKGLDIEELGLLQLKMELFEKSNLNKSAVDVAREI